MDDLIERLNKVADLIDDQGHIVCAEIIKQGVRRIEKLQSGGCQFAGPGRGDCEHFVGLPDESNLDQYDAYGKPNGWCWICWYQQQIRELENDK